MTRVDSEVLLTRLTLKRLGSTGFEGDALDRLGRVEGEEEGEWEDLRNVVAIEPIVVEEEEEEGEGEGEDEIQDWADRYARDSFITLKRPISPPSPTYSSSSSSTSLSNTSSDRRAWKWNPLSSTTTPMLPNSTSSSTVSSSTSIGSLSMSMSRNWSKSSLMDELEKQVGRISVDYSCSHLPEGEGEEEGEEYVCALDLIWESDEEEIEEEKEKEVAVRRGGGPLKVNLAIESRLPRLKPSVSVGDNLGSSTGTGKVMSASGNGFVSRMVKPQSVVKNLKAGWV